eukprot:GEMP01111370.1.p1 GENE.GEMP01111370.1~~GEMP01111370.1.p1  ORF type:complete len:139 (+),score=14.20 GEMP01111370.1:270-686(+)
MKTRTYFQFFYVLSPEPPFHMQKVSTEFCIRGSGTFAQPWKGRIGGNETWCESVQFIGGMTLRPVQPMGQPAIARPFAYELILALGMPFYRRNEGLLCTLASPQKKTTEFPYNEKTFVARCETRLRLGFTKKNISRAR